MNKEIREIIKAFHKADREGRQAALATVVHVEGSSYRGAGARMLVEDNGNITGAISGGCLEGDALRKALLAMTQQQNRLVTYNTLHEDDAEFGVQLGCNGIVHILFEPVDPLLPGNPVAILEKTCTLESPAILITLFSLSDASRPQPGTCLLYSDTVSVSTLAGTDFSNIVQHDAARALTMRQSFLREYDSYGFSAFFELLSPPVSLVIVGAGNDVIPVVNMADMLGWQTTIIDGRGTHANARRFPTAHRVIVAKPQEAIKQLAIGERTMFVIMTHNYNYDLEIMRTLLPVTCRYIGALGPKRRLERMLAELQEQGEQVTNEHMKRVYGPVGLDVGAETPAEIAVSIIAEIQAVVAGHEGGLLRDRQSPIHSRPSFNSGNEQGVLKSVV